MDRSWYYLTIKWLLGTERLSFLSSTWHSFSRATVANVYQDYMNSEYTSAVYKKNIGAQWWLQTMNWKIASNHIAIQCTIYFVFHMVCHHWPTREPLLTAKYQILAFYQSKKALQLDWGKLVPCHLVEQSILCFEADDWVYVWKRLHETTDSVCQQLYYGSWWRL